MSYDTQQPALDDALPAPVCERGWEEVHRDDGTVILRWSWRIDLANMDRFGL